MRTMSKAAQPMEALPQESVPPERIRNFSVVAHIDAGKSTLSDRLMERCGAIEPIMSKPVQSLDRLQIERERGITVKAQAASVLFENHLLNLIDTPGHVDFSSEVKRSLQACDGAILLCDATQGVQAQTLSNLLHAFELDLAIIPVVNKIDAQSADPESTADQMVNVCGVSYDEIIFVSAKHGTGIDSLLNAIIGKVPSPQLPLPKSNLTASTRALLLDSFYNQYRGTIVLALVKEGIIEPGTRIASLLSPGTQHCVAEVGFFVPNAEKATSIKEGRLGYLVTGSRSLQGARIGDTLYSPPEHHADVEPIAEMESSKPSVYQSIFPARADEYERLRRGIEQLCLSDASVSVEQESSEALGLGFRAGFLGVLHAEVFRARLREESAVDVISTAPTVPYRVRARKHDSEWTTVRNAVQFEEMKSAQGTSLKVQEPVVEATVILPSDRLGTMLNLAAEYRAIALENTHLSSSRVMLRYDVPLAEMPSFTERTKQVTSGWASIDYQSSQGENGYRTADVDVLHILLNKERVDALASIVSVDRARERGRALCQRLKERLQRHAFEIRLQASYSNRIVASESIPAAKKDVTAKLYGGDFSRRKKLLDNQKEGQKKASRVGRVELDPGIFAEVLREDAVS